MNWIDRFHSCILNQNHLDRQLSWFAEALNHWKVESGATLFQDFFSKDYLEHKVEHLCTRFGCLGYFGIVTIFTRPSNVMQCPVLLCSVGFATLASWGFGVRGGHWGSEARNPSTSAMMRHDIPRIIRGTIRVATESTCHVMSVEQPRDAWQLSWLQVDARDRLSCYATFHVMWNAKLASKCDRHAIVCSSVLLPCCLSRPYPPFQFWWLWTVTESEEKKTSTVTTETPSISTAERHLPACGGMWHLGMV